MKTYNHRMDSLSAMGDTAAEWLKCLIREDRGLNRLAAVSKLGRFQFHIVSVDSPV